MNLYYLVTTSKLRKDAPVSTQWLGEVKSLLLQEKALQWRDPIAAGVFTTDNTKAVFNGAVKTANQALKSQATQLFGESSTDVYLQKARSAVQGQLQALTLAVDENT